VIYEEVYITAKIQIYLNTLASSCFQGFSEKNA